MNFFNAISDNPNPPPAPSHVSIDVRWRGHGERRRVHDEQFGFEGRFVDGPASIRFAASNDGSGVVYRSVAEGQRTIYAGVGHERNGIFFD